MSPIERAAQAAYSFDWPAGHNPPYADWNETTEDMRQRYRGIARAALQAIREPSEGIIAAMRENVPCDGHEWEFMEREELSNGFVIDQPGDCWRAMIDAVLDEPGHTAGHTR